MKKFGVIGSGLVGESLANGLLKLGYLVMRSSRSPEKLNDWQSKQGPNAFVGTDAQAAAFGAHRRY